MLASGALEMISDEIIPHYLSFAYGIKKMNFLMALKWLSYLSVHLF